MQLHVVVREVDVEGQGEDKICRVDVEAEKVPRPGDLHPLLFSEFGKAGADLKRFSQTLLGRFQNVENYDSIQMY